MRNSYCGGQNEFSGGESMCTTASMCMGIAVLSGKVNPDKQEDDELSAEMQETMCVAGKGHLNISQQITGGKCHSTQTSIDDIIACANINLASMGLASKSYLISRDAGTRGFTMNDGEPTTLHAEPGKGSSGLLYNPKHDCVSPSTFPELLIPCSWDASSNVMAILTCNHHSVLLLNGPATRGYAFFDPLSGHLITEMNRWEMQDTVSRLTMACQMADCLVITTSSNHQKEGRRTKL